MKQELATGKGAKRKYTRQKSCKLNFFFCLNWANEPRQETKKKQQINSKDIEVGKEKNVQKIIIRVYDVRKSMKTREKKNFCTNVIMNFKAKNNK